MPYVGGFTTRDGTLCDEVSAGDIYLHQDYYGTSTMGYLSSVFVALDSERLDQVMRSISGGQSLDSLATSVVIRGVKDAHGAAGVSKLWSLVSLIDSLCLGDSVIPSCVGLDEQFYRLLSLSLLEACDRFGSVKRHWEASKSDWKKPLDELVDYIRANAHDHLTLTDLEKRSHYSARHLQNLFKEKLDCTPMQFVRRQRLASAMERLQMAEFGDTVTRISRKYGYVFVSNFTNDFKRQFGVTPSAVLRASRRRWE